MSAKVEAFRHVKITKMNRYKDGNMLIEIPDKIEFDKIMAITSIGTTTVKVSPHSALNTSRGVVYDPDFQNFSSEEELVNFFAQFGVIKAFHFTRKDKITGVISKTNSVCLTFNSPNLPTEIKIKELGLIFKVKPYYPMPRRCFNCNKYGHTNKDCRRDLSCPFCGKTHSDDECDVKSEPSSHLCSNCEENHPVFSKECKEYIRQTDIIKIMVDEKLPRREARNESYRRRPDYGKSFASAASTSSMHENKTLGVLLGFIKSRITDSDTPPHIKSYISDYESNQVRSKNSSTTTQNSPAVTPSTSRTPKSPSKSPSKSQPKSPNKALSTTPPSKSKSQSKQPSSEFQTPKNPSKVKTLEITPTPLKNKFGAISAEAPDSKQESSKGLVPANNSKRAHSQSSSSASPPVKKGNNDKGKINFTYNRPGRGGLRKSASHRDLSHFSEDAAYLQDAYERDKWK